MLSYLGSHYYPWLYEIIYSQSYIYTFIPTPICLHQNDNIFVE